MPRVTFGQSAHLSPRGTSWPRPFDRDSRCDDTEEPLLSYGQAGDVQEKKTPWCLRELDHVQKVMDLQTPVGSEG